MRTAIVAAMHQELAAVLALLPDEQKQVAGGRDFWVGHLHGQEVVAVLSRVGKVAAATTATALIERFGVRRIVFTGVAGGLGPEVQVGHVVVNTATDRPWSEHFCCMLVANGGFSTSAFALCSAVMRLYLLRFFNRLGGGEVFGRVRRLPNNDCADVGEQVCPESVVLLDALVIFTGAGLGYYSERVGYRLMELAGRSRRYLRRRELENCGG